jgi:uncharacterized damage-inducible protein DinB
MRPGILRLTAGDALTTGWQTSPQMGDLDLKDNLHSYLQGARETLVGKLDGLSEYDVRRPMVPTGTNLLGIVKHVALVESGYLGGVFGRPFVGPRLDVDPSEPNWGFWATAEESRETVVDFYRQVWQHSDATVEALDLEASGRVPWWPEERQEVTMHRILVHMTAETQRHAGHADIVRELIDGQVGFLQRFDNLPQVDEEWWAAYRDRLERTAREAAGFSTQG